jgi:hypothetical protein
VCILPELEAVEEHDVKMNGTLVVVRWPYLSHDTHLHIEKPNSTLKQLIALTTFEIIKKTSRDVDASFVLLRNRCPKTIGRKEKGA